MARPGGPPPHRSTLNMEPHPPAEPKGRRRTEINNRTLRTLFYDSWFRWSASVVLLFGIGGVLFVAKIHVASTPDIDPPERISYLDMVQARSLDRSARRLAAQGLISDAVTAWRSAVANNPANLAIYRGVLDALNAQKPLPRSEINAGVGAAVALLKRAGTNLTDTLRAVRLLSAAREFPACIPLLRAVEKDWDAEAVQLYALVLFENGMMAEFGRLMTSHPEAFKAPSETALIATAWKAAWGPPAGMTAARQELLEARRSLATGTLASRLQLQVSRELFDLRGYREALDQLASRSEDRVADHVRHWDLLVRAGRTTEARELAQRYSRAPDSAVEAAGLAGIFDALGMTRYGADFGSRQLQDFPFSQDLWLTTAELYLKVEEWSQAREIAVRMRSEPNLRGQLTAYSWYVEGWVDLKLQREGAADDNFARIADHRFSSPELAFRCGTGLRQLGRPALAKPVLLGIEAPMASNAPYWFELSLAAYGARDMPLLERAATTAYRLAPADPGIANNYAAVLIATETKPEESVTLTLRLLTRNPSSVDLLINHALALVSAGRIPDAEARLRPLRPEGLSPEENSVLLYARVRIAEEKGDMEAVKALLPRIRREFLMPPQVTRLEKLAERLQPKA